MDPGSNALSEIFSALSDANRRTILISLCESEKTLTEVRDGLGISKQAVSKHVQILEDAGIVNRRVDGRNHYLRVRPDAFENADAWIRQCRSTWMNNLDRLARHLATNGEY